MQARLKVLHDKANVKQVKLLPVTLIGRSTECNLKIASSQVSRNHCRITLATDAVYVEDLGSANGTLVDGQLIPAHQPTAISPGAHLIVGPAEFQIDYVAPTSATMVLPRTGVPPVAELPSTEMIFPPTLPKVASAAVEAAPANVETVAVTAAAVIASAVATTEVPPRPLLNDTASEPGEENPFAPDPTVPDESNEATVFMFQESIPDSIPFGNNPAPNEPAGKKGALKGLFSLFGRKDKPAAVAAETPAASASPSVFLPTMETQAEVESGDVAESVAPVVDDTADTVELTGDATPQTSSEEDNGFQQFLSQF